jgi:O-antigen/teichoic acid export membrane protein
MGAYLLGGVIIPLLFSARYVASISLFQILVVGTLFSALVNPLHGGLVAMVSPRRIVVVTAAGLVAMVAGGSLVIPAMGSTGAAVLVGIVRIGIGASVLLMAHAVLRSGGPLTVGAAGASAARQRQEISETDCRFPGEPR